MKKEELKQTMTTEQNPEQIRAGADERPIMAAEPTQTGADEIINKLIDFILEENKQLKENYKNTKEENIELKKENEDLIKENEDLMDYFYRNSQKEKPQPPTTEEPPTMAAEPTKTKELKICELLKQPLVLFLMDYINKLEKENSSLNESLNEIYK